MFLYIAWHCLREGGVPSTLYLLLICTQFKQLTFFFKVMAEMRCAAKCPDVPSQVNERPRFRLVFKTMEAWSEAAPTMPSLRDIPPWVFYASCCCSPNQCSKRHYKDPKSRREQVKKRGAQRIVFIESRGTGLLYGAW